MQFNELPLTDTLQEGPQTNIELGAGEETTIENMQEGIYLIRIESDTLHNTRRLKLE